MTIGAQKEISSRYRVSPDRQIVRSVSDGESMQKLLLPLGSTVAVVSLQNYDSLLLSMIITVRLFATVRLFSAS